MTETIIDTVYFYSTYWYEVFPFVFWFIMGVAFVWLIRDLYANIPLWESLRRWVASSIGAIIIISLCLYISPYFFPDDRLILWRFIIVRLVGVCIGIVAVVGALLFIDSVTPGNWLDKVEKSPYGAVVILAAAILALALIIVYA